MPTTDHARALHAALSPAPRLTPHLLQGHSSPESPAGRGEAQLVESTSSPHEIRRHLHEPSPVVLRPIQARSSRRPWGWSAWTNGGVLSSRGAAEQGMGRDSALLLSAREDAPAPSSPARQDVPARPPSMATGAVSSQLRALSEVSPRRLMI